MKRSHPFYLTSGCIDEHATNGVYICPNHFAEFQIGWNSVVYKDVTTIEGHVKITRTDKTSAPLFLCGGACNGGTAVKESMTQQDGAFGTLMLWRDYYVHLNTESMPTSLNVRLGAVRHAINKDNNAPYNVYLAMPPHMCAGFTRIRKCAWPSATRLARPSTRSRTTTRAMQPPQRAWRP